jgi:hypothetical protein
MVQRCRQGEHEKLNKSDKFKQLLRLLTFFYLCPSKSDAKNYFPIFLEAFE